MDKLKKSDLRLVILKCPYINFDSQITRELFRDVLLLKYRGYGNRHEFGSLPLDTSDFVADHPILCLVGENNSLTPISGSKVISYDTCKFFNLEFAMQSCFKKNSNFAHLEALNKITGSSENSERKVVYHGGYTIDPQFADKNENRDLIREMFIASTVLYFQKNKITDLLGLGVPKFKTELFFYSWGYERVLDLKTGLPLPEFPLHFLPNTEGVMMHLSRFSLSALETAMANVDLWTNRLEIGKSLQIPGVDQAA